MFKTAAAITSLLAASASAFAPSSFNGRLSTAVAAEKSQSLPFMNRPPLVSDPPLASRHYTTKKQSIRLAL
jgi:hypothetical protein